MVYCYKDKRPDGVHDECVAYAVLLMWHGVKYSTIRKGVKMAYGVTVKPEQIRRYLPYYLGAVAGYAPNEIVVRMKKMLGGEVP